MKLLKKIAVVGCALWLVPNLALAQEMTAAQTAELGVKTLVQTVVANKAYFLSDRDRYYAAIEAVLDSFVDFPAVAEVVMSRYAASATDEQKLRFASILQSTLTRFYGASLVSYEGQELVFLPNTSKNSDPRADTVVGMELRGGDSAFRLQYQMFLNSNDEWKLKNLSLAGINLGRQYFTQFSALMTKYNNDIDQVLNNWQ